MSNASSDDRTARNNAIQQWASSSNPPPKIDTRKRPKLGPRQTVRSTVTPRASAPKGTRSSHTPPPHEMDIDGPNWPYRLAWFLAITILVMMFLTTWTGDSPGTAIRGLIGWSGIVLLGFGIWGFLQAREQKAMLADIHGDDRHTREERRHQQWKVDQLKARAFWMIIIGAIMVLLFFVLLILWVMFF